MQWYRLITNKENKIMARIYGRRKEQIRMWAYIGSAIVVALVIVLIYSGGDDESAELPAVTETKPAIVAKSAVVAKPEPKLTVPQVPSEPVEALNQNAKDTINKAMELVNATPSGIIEARDLLNEVLTMSITEDQRFFVKEQLTKLSRQWLFSKEIYPDDEHCKTYKVKPGDLLSNIGKQYEVPYEIIMDINKIRSPQSLRAGEIIKVIQGPFHARIYRSKFTMDLYLKDTFVRSFAVGLGKTGYDTPIGLWKVKPGGKMISPTWTDPDTGKTYEAEDPDYPLGSRWIGLEGIKGDAIGRTGFAIHGTKDPSEIGTAESRGCIRLHNGNAILVYNLLVPTSSLVEIVD